MDYWPKFSAFTLIALTVWSKRVEGWVQVKIFVMGPSNGENNREFVACDIFFASVFILIFNFFYHIVLRFSLHKKIFFVKAKFPRILELSLRKL